MDLYGNLDDADFLENRQRRSPIQVVFIDQHPLQSVEDTANQHMALYSTSAILLTIAGFILLLVGYKFSRIAIMLISGILLASVAMFIALMIDGSLSDTTILIIELVVGSLGGLIGYSLYKKCLILIGALSGIYLGLVILQLKQPILIENQTARIIVVLVAAALGMIFIKKVERTAIITGTSVIGSYLIMLAVDLFANWGFKNSLLLWKAGDFQVSNNNAYILIVTFAITSIVGVLIQWRHNRK